MYVIDSPTQTVQAFPYAVDSGELGPSRVLVEIPTSAGIPDGMCTDDHGYLWVALWGGGVVHRYTPQGRLDTVVEVPASQVSSCCFGGPRGDRLYITSATYQLTGEQLEREPLAGALFAVDLSVSGPPATPWSVCQESSL